MGSIGVFNAVEDTLGRVRGIRDIRGIGGTVGIGGIRDIRNIRDVRKRTPQNQVQLLHHTKTHTSIVL